MFYRLFTVIFVFVSASQGAAQEVECKEAVALAANASAMVKTINGLTQICKERIGSDKTCQDYARLMKENHLPEYMLAFATGALSLSEQCPD